MHAMSTVTYRIACIGGLLRARVMQFPGGILQQAFYRSMKHFASRSESQRTSIHVFPRACIVQRCDPRISCTSRSDIHQQACILTLRAQEHSAPMSTSPT